MAEETVDLAIKQANLPFGKSVTKHLPIHGSTKKTDNSHLAIYGTDRESIQLLIQTIPDLGNTIHPNFPYTKAEIIWCCRNEMAETLEDLLSRRLRVLMIDAKAAIEMAPTVAQLMAQEHHLDQAWRDRQVKDFTALALGYCYHPTTS